MTGTLIGDLVMGGLAGLALGGLHLLWLGRAVAGLGQPGRGLNRLLAGAALRLAMVIAGFAAVAWAAAQTGPALIAALAGFVLARSVGLRRLGPMRE